MRPVTAKEILWIKTIEEGDLRGEVFPFEERIRATSAVIPGEGIPDEPTHKQAVEILSRRAREADSYLTNSCGQIAAIPSRHLSWPLILSGICLLAFAAGLASDRIANRHTINVISAPLLGVLAWNFLVYLWNLLSPLLGRKKNPGSILTLLGNTFGLGIEETSARRKSSPPWGKLRNNFLARWTALTSRAQLFTLSSGLHLGAAFLALGQISGLYLGGLIRSYLAVWESTFLDQSDFETLSQNLFAPAHWLTGIPIEITAEMEARGGSAQAGGVPAENWIHLCAATLFLLVILPRLVLALTCQIRAWAAWKNTFSSLDLSSYTSDLLRQITRCGMDVAVITCGAELPEATHETLTRSLQHAIGKPNSLRFIDGPAYGEEETYLKSIGDIPDIALLVFQLTTTPEEETQGLLADLISRSIRTPSHNDGRVIGILFADRFEEKFHDLPEYTDRLNERKEAWAHVLSPKNVIPVTWNSKAPVSELGEALAEALTPPATTNSNSLHG